ncbi:MAG: primosomal protein N' [Cyclobacteriaceae bacterium]
MWYAEVILPLPLEGTFTYRFPNHLYHDDLVGCRVTVPLGKRKYYTGVICQISDKAKVEYTLKEVTELLDDSPILTANQLTFIRWLSAYYMAAIGDCYNATLPSGLKLSSESFIGAISDAEVDYSSLSENERIVLQFLESQELSTEEVKKITGLKHPYALLKSLTEKGAIYHYEKVKDKYSPKTEQRIRLGQQYVDDVLLNELALSLEKKTKQYDVLLAYLNNVPLLEDPSMNENGLAKKDFLTGHVSESSLKTLIKHGIFELWHQKIDRFSLAPNEEIKEIPLLTEIQEVTLKQIKLGFEHKLVTLFKGITGSGKTEIYMHLIQEIVDNGGTALYLLPEIALTTQIISRFRKYFGNRFAIYHSRFSDNERVEIYQNCLAGKYDFVIGVRSAVFLPLSNLQLVIVDEEHEPSYKQYDPAPRYHARDAAIYLAQLHQAKVLLGSATPSLESYHNAQEDKYAYVTLDHRYGDQPLPKIEVLDITKARKQRRLKGNFSDDLLERIQRSIDNQKQVILFQNRRGYAPYVSCDDCQHIPNCPNCAVSLTYHIYQNQLICHYCGFKQAHGSSCEKCNSNQVRTVGTGTEQIEEELSVLMPNIKIKRMDLDTTRNKYSYQQIIDDFEAGEIQVLIGTQMISKGLDFEHVDLVGLFDVDRIIHFPDFRSHERAFQLMTQVSGRSGRKHERGTVMMQTKDPEQPILNQIREGHLDIFYAQELAERRSFKYPPYHRLINIIVRHKDKTTAMQASNKLTMLLKTELHEHRVFGPIEPLIGRIRNYYIFEILVKLEKHQLNHAAVKQFISSSKDTLLALPTFKTVRIHFDVDPL